MAVSGLRPAVFGGVGLASCPANMPPSHSVEAVFRQHLDGINCSRLGKRERIGAATVERHFRHGLQRHFSEKHSRRCPPILGIDEHFFTRRKGFATTLCDLKNHTIYDVVPGRSEASLDSYLQCLEGKDQVRIVCMDLSSTYRSLVKSIFLMHALWPIASM
jgi:transposase